MPAIHSRRVFLAAGPAAAVFASLSAAARAKALSSDPIFAAIACHEAANSRYLAACKLTDDIEAEEGRAVTQADEAEYEAASVGGRCPRSVELLATPPATKAGARAGLDYFMSLDGSLPRRLRRGVARFANPRRLRSNAMKTHETSGPDDAARADKPASLGVADELACIRARATSP